MIVLATCATSPLSWPQIDTTKNSLCGGCRSGTIAGEKQLNVISHGPSSTIIVMVRTAAVSREMEKDLQVIDWQMIVKEHGSAVWQTAYRLPGNHADASDCFQETFISALELSRRQRIRNFRPLLARLTTTRAIDQLRRRMRHTEPSDAESRLTDVVSGYPNPVQRAAGRRVGRAAQRIARRAVADGSPGTLPKVFE